MPQCTSCGKPLGSSKACKVCLDYRIRQDAEKMNEERAQKAASGGEEWLRKRGKSAPQKLIALVGLFIEIMRDIILQYL